MGLETICVVGDYLCWTHPLKLPYLDTWGSRLISWLEVKAMAGKLTHLKVKAICHIWKSMCFWRSRLVIWPPWLNHLSLSFWSQLYMQQHLICASLIQTCYISKLNSKCNENMLEIKRKQCLQLAQVRKFYLIVKVGYYPLMPLACTSI